jgi:hypothetical protein
MRRTTAVLGAAILGVMVTAAGPVWACGYGVPSPLARFNAAEWVVVGKITTYEQHDVEVAASPDSAAKQTFAVAILEITKSIKGADGMTHIRVAMHPQQTLPVGQEACYFLNSHPTEAFCVMPGRFGLPIVKAGNTGFENEVQQYESWAKILKDPMESLKAKDAGDRFLAAALLLNEYRTFRPGVHAQNRETKPIDPAQSKLILQALVDVDWNKAVLDRTVSANGVFAQLAPTIKDGWNPKNLVGANGFEVAAKKWLTDNSDSFRINAFVRQ